MLAARSGPRITIVTALPALARNKAACPEELPPPATTAGEPAHARPANAKRAQRRQLRVVQLPEGIIGLSRQGRLILSPFERSATRPAPPRCPRAPVRTTNLLEVCGERVSRAPSSCIAM